MFEIQHVAESLHFTGVVVEHQKDAGQRQHKKQIKGNAAHPPRVTVTDRVAIDLCGVQMQEDVGENAQSAVAGSVIMLVAEDGSIKLSLGRLAENLDLFFRLRRQIALQ